MMEKIRQGKDGKVRVGIANWATTVKKSNDGKDSRAMMEKVRVGIVHWAIMAKKGNHGSRAMAEKAARQ